jgi:hypothetical protein
LSSYRQKESFEHVLARRARQPVLLVLDDALAVPHRLDAHGLSAVLQRADRDPAGSERARQGLNQCVEELYAGGRRRALDDRAQPLLAVAQAFVHLPQLRGTAHDRFLEAVAVLGKLAVAGLDLGEHVVEAVDQSPDLVVAELRGADAVVFFARDQARSARQAQDGLRDHVLEA